jgi:DNA (cytosine-5)-methyltransferase 1
MDLFAGCGGMTRGFVDSGRFQPVFAVEASAEAATTYAANLGAHIVATPIEHLESFPEVDVVMGGPPCQAFSTLNRSLVGFERRGLWRQYVRALRDSGPLVFVMENVPQLLRSEEFASFCRSVNRLGYKVEGRILNAADYGVPQRRMRAFAIGSRVGLPAWPDPMNSDPARPTVGTKPWRTFRDAVDGLSLTPDGVNWHRPRNPRPESLIRYRAVPRDGGNRFEMQEQLESAGLGHLVLPCFRRKPTGTTDVFGRLWWDRPAVTIRTEFHKPEKGRYLHPTEDRPITPREAARCMGFDDQFVFPETQSLTSVARQIGNAVPPPLARRLAQGVAAMLDEHASLHASAA